MGNSPVNGQLSIVNGQRKPAKLALNKGCQIDSVGAAGRPPADTSFVPVFCGLPVVQSLRFLFVANANATQNLRCICVVIIVIINATQMNRKEKEAEFCGAGKQYVGI